MGAGFSGAEAASHNLLDEVLEEATYLKEPTIMLLASFTSCLLAECLSKGMLPLCLLDSANNRYSWR
jgi:hypothetical protein